PADVDLGVPDVQVVHAREYAHRHAVPAHRRQHDLPPVFAAEPVVPGRYLQAGGQPLDVPLPRAGQGLVEVVDVEEELALGRGIHPEVGQVRVPAGLDGQAGDGGGGQVGGHGQGGTPVVAERGGQHPPIPDRDQLGYPGTALFLQQGDRVRPAGGRVEDRVA